MEKERAIKISFMIVAMLFIILVWVATLRYNLQGGFKRPALGSRATTTSTFAELEVNIKTAGQQLSKSWQLLKEVLHKK